MDSPQGQPLDIGIIGGGTAGSASALFLARAGHRVTVYERVPEPGPVGAGIVLQPSGQWVLEQLGLLEEIARRGAPIYRLFCETPQRRTVIDLSYEQVSASFFGLGLHRGVIFQSLFEAMKREPSIRLRLGVGIERLAPAEDGRHFAVEGEPGRTHGPHDLIVVADGARSRLREDATLSKRVRHYPWGALWFVGADPQHEFKEVLYQMVRGTQRLIGFLPTGLGPEGDVPCVSLFWSLRADHLDAWHRNGLDPWKRELLAHVPRSAFLVEQIHSPEQLRFSAYHDVVMWPWHAPGVVYLGDAAHAMSPQLGQGCNLALWDAWILSLCLAEQPGLATALAAYSQRRRAHLGFYQFATRWLTPFFQSDHTALGWLRDAFMGMACRMPWIGRQMVLSMCGLSLGPFLPPLPLGPPSPALSPGL